MNLALINTGPNPMGLVYLGSWVRQRLPEIQISVLQADNLPSDMRQYDVIGLSAMTLWYEQACEIAARIKKQFPWKVLVLGGVHISVCPESSRGIFDAEFKGEAEKSFTAWLQNQPMPACQHLESLEHYPDIDLNLYPSNTWKPRLTRATMDYNVVGTLLTSRGCPFTCRFCSTTQFYETYRTHTPEWTIKQIENLAAKGVDYLQIWDDLFTVKIPRLKAIADLWEKSGVGKQIKTVCLQGRADVTTDEVCEHLRRMNVHSLGFGYESGNNRVLKYLKKSKASVQLNDTASALCRKHGIKPFGFIMLGNPTETFKEMLDTVWWVAKNAFRIDDIITYAPAPYPGTEFWKIACAKGKVSNAMNFNKIVIHSKIPWNAMMYDTSIYQFLLAWFLLQVVTLPYKTRKAWNIYVSIINKCRLMVLEYSYRLFRRLVSSKSLHKDQ